jgi:hypothetical protein
MRARCWLTFGLLLLVAIFNLHSSFAWGHGAQRLITNKAIETLPDDIRPFFEANRQYLAQHVVDPEAEEKRDPRLENLDFIKIDHYGPFPFTNLPRSYAAAVAKFGRRSVYTYGVLPWQVGTYSKKLTDAFEARNLADAKLAAALLAHYVAESHDPFNTTMNWDGKLSGQPGVNQRFSVGLFDRFQLFFFVRPGEAVYIHDPTDHAFEMVLSAHSWLESVLLSDMRAHAGLSGYGDEYFDRFYSQTGTVLVRQLTDASTDLGSYWMTAWINAGRPQLPAQ